MFAILSNRKQRERQDLNLQPSTSQADALSNYATLSNLAENSGLEPQALKLHLFSKQRLSPDKIAFHIWASCDNQKGRAGVEPAVLKNSGFTDLYLRR